MRFLQRWQLLVPVFCLHGLYVLLFFSGCKKPPPDYLAWETLPQPTTQNLTSVWFLNKDTGFVAGGNTYTLGEIYKTTNGGKNWQLAHTTSKIIFDLQFLNDSIGYAVGYDNMLLRSSNGGNTWQAVNINNPSIEWLPLRSIYMLHDSLGFAVGGHYTKGIIYRLTQQGNKATATTFEQGLLSIHFISPTEGVALGYGASFTTANAGLSWQPATATNDYFVDLTTQPNTTNLFACSYFGSVATSTDKGQTWQTLRCGGGYLTHRDHLGGIVFNPLNAQQLYIGSENKLLVSTNAGRSFSKLPLEPSPNNWQALSATANCVYAVGSNGGVVRISW
ncbi:MAG: YCF48-related protein [Bacteroidetes bacterium]|jgi:photosystem II stability/assembly factor-like uncharacterized protein|nr:YCF48-related protein [Bacteroidota bacterium]